MGEKDEAFWGTRDGVLGKTWSALESTIGGYWGEKINKNMLTKIAILSRVNDRKRAKGRGA